MECVLPFTPGELRELITGRGVGSWEVDSLRAMLRPVAPYDWSNPVMEWLLEELLAMDKEAAASFLMFCTSAPTVGGPGFAIEIEHAPFNELAVIQAHVCKQNGGTVHLPEYPSREALHEALLMPWSTGHTEF